MKVLIDKSILEQALAALDFPESAPYCARKELAYEALKQAIGSAPSQEPSTDEQWLPITTAPKDGRWVITFDGDCVCPNYYLASEIEQWAKTPLLITPTHWIPLPKPPAAYSIGAKP